VIERTYFQNAYECTLRADIGVNDLVFQVTDVGILVAPCLLVIEPDDNSKREYFRVDSINATPGSETFTIASISDRYLAGSAANSGLTHTTTDVATIYQTAQARHFEDIHDILVAKLDVTGKAADSEKLDGFDSTFFSTGAEFDAHNGVGGLTHPDVTPSVDGFMSAADKTKLDVVPFLHEEVDNVFFVSSFAIPETEADAIAVTLDIPAHWNGWKCQANASFDYDMFNTNLASSLFFEAKIRIDGLDVTVHDSLIIPNVDPGFNVQFPALHAVISGNAARTSTGSRTVSMRLDALSGIPTDVDAREIHLYARAVRTA